jgi:hypothetical protein
MTRVGRWLILAAAVCLTATAAFGQEKPAERPKTLLEEIVLFSYIENSVVFNLNGNGRGNHNELRLYDFDGGYTFNMAEFSAKKDPSERYPFGFGVVLTAGQDAQKNHALGIFRGSDDAFPFRNTPAFDLEEAYGAYKVPLGSGLTVKAGKFVTLLGYEVIESPNNLNFSRSFLFGLAIPFTHVGALLSYSPTEWLTVTAGPVVGWDVAKDNNDSMSVTGQFALTPFKDFTANFNWITGPEQASNTTHPRTVLDWTATYTGLKNVTLGANLDYGWETKEASLVASGTRNDTDASWWGIAGYGAYDWTEQLRTALRLEYFADPESVRSAARALGSRTSLWEVTGTLQYKIWRGLVGRLEYRHDQANEKVFKLEDHGLTPTAKNQDTISLALYYSFF